MAKVLVPSLHVAAKTVLRRTRELPISGTVTVAVGDVVKADAVVAKAEIVGELQILRLAETFGVTASEVKKYMTVGVGDSVHAEQLVCSRRALWGLLKQDVHSPVSGVVETISEDTGNVSIREPAQLHQIHAHIDGRVVEVLGARGVIIETSCAWVQGVFGIGGERRGILRSLAVSPETILEIKHLPQDCTGLVLFGGSAPSALVLREAAKRGAQALITASIDDQALRQYLGYDLGVAITGDEKVPMTVIVSEGFGNLSFSDRIIETLTPLEGRTCSVTGATQVRAGAVRPEIIVPHAEVQESAALQEVGASLEIGSAIRLIRFPHFGKRATICELPEQPERIATGAFVRVLRARMGNEVITVPRSNVEVIG